MAKTFILDHGMMSKCLMDGNFYESVPAFKAIHSVAAREYEIRKAAIEKGGKTGCNSCGKKHSAKVRAELAKRHGAVFSQLVSTERSKDPAYQFAGLLQYIRSHTELLTGKTGVAQDFEKVIAFIPMKNAQGTIEVVEMEI